MSMTVNGLSVTTAASPTPAQAGSTAAAADATKTSTLVAVQQAERNSAKPGEERAKEEAASGDE